MKNASVCLEFDSWCQISIEIIWVQSKFQFILNVPERMYRTYQGKYVVDS